MQSIATLQRRAESLVESLRFASPEDAERFDAALEIFWFDQVSLAEIVTDLRKTLAEELRS